MPSKSRNNLQARIKRATDAGNDLTIKASELRMINLKATEYWYDHYQQEDSPKGETVAGVNHRQFGGCTAWAGRMNQYVTGDCAK